MELTADNLPDPEIKEKTYFVLNSAEHESCPADKSQTIANSFLLNIAEHEIFSANEYENVNYYCWHFHIH